jgi:predicted metal-binding membrane protein
MAVIQEDLTPPVSRATALSVSRTSIRGLGVWLAVAGWASLTLMWATGSSELFGHDQGSVPVVPAMGLFLVGWVAMVAAMMLPSSVPTMARVDEGLVGEVRPAPTRFIGGYFVAWGAFGAAAFAGDGVLHLAVDNTPWLAQRPSLIAGGVAMLAGAAEMLGRTPPPLLPSLSREEGAFALGKTHAIDRIRRCWPLMLFAMAVGMASPVWMVGLTLLMALELHPRAAATLRAIGLVVFAFGAAVIVQPNWLPALVGR